MEQKNFEPDSSVNAKSSISKPPPFPKTHSNSHLYVHRQRQLKDRLKLKWGQSQRVPEEPFDDSHDHNAGEMTGLAKGFGENQFNDSYFEENPIRYNDKYSTTFGEELSGLLQIQSNVKDGTRNKTYLTALPSQYEASHDLTQNSVMSIGKDGIMDELSAYRSHLNLSNVLVSDGYDEVANQLTEGKADFCYLIPDPDDFYRFGISDQFPAQESANYQNFSALSARGLLRFHPEGSELVPFPIVAKEKVIYDQLLKLKFFKDFWKFKSFAIWKRFIVARRMDRLSNTVGKNLVLLDPLCRDLILSSRKTLDLMTKENIFTVDGTSTIPFEEFASLQRRRNRYWKGRIKDSIREIATVLCDRCEEHIMEAATVAQPSFLNRDLNQTGKTSHQDKSTTFPLLAAVEEMKNRDTSKIHPTLPNKSTKIGSPRKKLLSKPLNSNNPEILQSKEVDDKDYSEPNQISVPYSVRASIRLRCRKLTTLFRIIDYMIRDKLYEFLQLSLIDFYSILQEFGDIPYNEAKTDYLLHVETDSEGNVVVHDRLSEGKQGILQVNVIYLATSEAEKEIQEVEMSNHQERVSEDMDSREGGRERSNSIEKEQTELEMVTRITHTEFLEINFQPSKIRCLETLRDLLTEICSYCSYIDGLLSHDRCYKIFKPIHAEMNVVPLDDRIFVQDEQNHIQSIVKEILYYFSSQCDRVYQDIQRLDYLRLELSENQELYRHAMTSKLLQTAPEVLSSHLSQWQSQSINCTHLRNQQRIGIFHCELKTIKHTFTTLLRLNQQLYYRLIPDLYVTHGDEFYREISNDIDKMNYAYRNLEEFIKVLEAYQYCFQRQEIVHQKFKYILNIREIVEAHPEIRISEAILRQNLTLTTVFHKFNTLLEQFDDLLEEQVKHYRTEMQLRLKKIVTPLQDCKTYIDQMNALMMQEDYQPPADEIIVELTHYQEQLAIVSKQLSQLDYYQKMLKIMVFEKGMEVVIAEELQSNIFLWQSWKTLEELMQNFFSVSFLDANCDQILKEVLIVKSELTANNYFSLINEKVNQAMNVTGEEGQANLTLDNEISSATRGVYKCYHKILSMASILLDIIPIIKKLQSNTYQAEHIQAIHQLISRPIYDDIDVTVSELLNSIHIRDYADQIEEIYNQSRIQYYLELKVNTYAQYLLSIEFQFLNDVDNKALIYISNFIDISEKLQDTLLTLQSIGASQSVYAIQEQVQALIHQVSTWIEAIAQFQIFQQKYLQYRTLFTSAKTARQLAPYMKYFKLIDENWRTLIRLSKGSTSIAKFLEGENQSQVFSILQTVTQSTISNIEKGIVEIIDDQCEKYPKFYFIDRQSMIELLTNNRLFEILQTLANFCFPYRISQIEVDPQESYNVMGIYCQEEKMIFQKAVSGRSTLADFCKTIESMIHDRLERDVKELLVDHYTTLNNSNANADNNQHNNLLAAMNITSLNATMNRQLVENIQSGKFCEQAIILLYQVKFWSSLDRIIQQSSEGKRGLNRVILVNSSNAAAANGRQRFSVQAEEDEEDEDMKRNLFYNLRSLLVDLTDQISMVSSILTTEANNPLVTKKVSNVIITIIYFRDLVRAMIEDEMGLSNGEQQQRAGPDDGYAEQQLSIHTEKAYFSLQKRVIFQQQVQSSTLPYYSAAQFHEFSETNNFSAMNANSTANPVIVVQQAGFFDRYAMKYQGFGQRLIITPLVDKCFFALTTAFRYKHHQYFNSSHSFQVPILQAQFPKSLFLGLAYELGADCQILDVTHASFLRQHNPLEFLTKCFIVSFRLNLFFGLNHLELWTSELLSLFGNLMAELYETLYVQRQEAKFVFESSINAMSFNNIMNPPTLNTLKKDKESTKSTLISKRTVVISPQSSSGIFPRICLLHSLVAPNRFPEIFQTNQLYLPIHVPFISCEILFRTLLISFNFVFVQKITARLEAMLDYLTTARIATRQFLIKLFMHAIRLVGVENEHGKINVSMQLNMIVKRVFQLLPLNLQCRLSESEIRLLCNLFLEVVYHPENDRKDFYSFLRPYEYEITLKRMLMPKLYYSHSNYSYYEGSGNHSLDPSYDAASVGSNTTISDEEKEWRFSRDLRNNVIVVVGSCSSGKTTLISNTCQAIQKDIEIMSHQQYGFPRITSGNGSLGYGDDTSISIHSNSSMNYQQQPAHVLKVFASPFNPLILIDCEQQEPIEGITVRSHFTRILERLVEQELQSIYQSTHYTFVFHLDISSSYHLAFLLPEMIDYWQKFYPNQQIKIVFEATELIDLCPSSLINMNVLAIHDSMFTLEEVLMKSYRQYTDGTSHYYQKAIAEIRDAVIRPCLVNYPADSLLSQFELIKQIFQVISDLFHLLIFPIHQGTGQSRAYDVIITTSTTTAATTSNITTSPMKSKEVKKQSANYNDFEEDSLRRIGIFACIWTVGTCSPTSRNSFERWFREFFSDEMMKTRSRKIFPVFDPSISIFKYNLQRVEGTIPSLEWVQCDAKLLSSISNTSNVNTSSNVTSNRFLSCSATQDLLCSTTFFSRNFHELLVVNAEMRALAYLQAAMSHTIYQYLSGKNLYLTDAQRGSSGIHICGSPHSGKKTILHYLLQQLSYFPRSTSLSHQKHANNQGSTTLVECCRRWVFHAHSEGKTQSLHPSTLQRYLLQSKRQLSTYLLEHNLPDYGALFLEDVNIDHPGAMYWKRFSDSPNQIPVPVSEMIRHVMEFQTIYDHVYQQFVKVPMFYTVFNSSSNRNLSRDQQREAYSHQGLYNFDGSDKSEEKTLKISLVPGLNLGNQGSPAVAQKEGLNRQSTYKTEFDYNFHERHLNQRLLKKFLTFYCCEETIKDVFSTMLHRQHTVMNMTVELAKDLTNLTYNFFENVQSIISQLQLHPLLAPHSSGGTSFRGTSVSGSNGITSLLAKLSFSSFTEREKMALYSFQNQPCMMWTQSTISRLSSALSFLQFHAVIVSPNDIIRVWDRIINDLNCRFPLIDRMSSIFQVAFEEAINGNNADTFYESPSFVSILERERSIRMSNMDNVLSSYSAPTVDEAISYTRNCMGYFKTMTTSQENTTTSASTAFTSSVPFHTMTASAIMTAIGQPGLPLTTLVSPVISTAESLRDTIFKQIMARNIQLHSPVARVEDIDDDNNQESEVTQLVRIEEAYRTNKSNISFWTDLLRIINALQVKETSMISEVALLEAVNPSIPSPPSIILLINDTELSFQKRMERLRLLCFHLNRTKLREVVINDEIIDDYLHSSASSTGLTEKFHQTLLLLALENFFHDPYVLKSLRSFVKSVAKKKHPLVPTVSPSTDNSYRRKSSIIVTPEQIEQLIERSRAVNVPGGSVSHEVSNHSSRRSSRAHIVPSLQQPHFLGNLHLSQAMLEDSIEKNRQRLHALLQYIQLNLFSPSVYEEGLTSKDEDYNGAEDLSQHFHCRPTVWMLNFPSNLSYEINQETSRNVLLNHALITQMINEIQLIGTSSAQDFFFEYLHEDFQAVFYEELRDLFHHYSQHQHIIIQLHDGQVGVRGQEKDHRAIPSELFASLLRNLPGMVHICDLYPERLAKVEPAVETVTAKGKARGESEESVKSNDGKDAKSIMSENASLANPVVNASTTSREKEKDLGLVKQTVQDYFSLVQQFIEKNKLIEKKYHLNPIFMMQHLKYLHKTFFPSPSSSSDATSRAPGNSTSWKKFKSFLENLFSSFSLSSYNQAMIYNIHNDLTVLENLDSFHLLAVMLLSITCKSVLIKIAGGLVNDAYAYTTSSSPYLIEYMMKKNILSLSAASNHSDNEDGERTKSEGYRETIAAPHLFIPYFQLFSSNLQMNVLAYIFHETSISSEFSSLDKTLVSSNFQIMESFEYFLNGWKYYQLSPRTSAVKHYLPAILNSQILFGRWIIRDATIFTSFLLFNLLEVTDPSVLIESGKLISEVRSKHCFLHEYDQEKSPAFVITNLDIPFLAEVLVLSLLSKGKLEKIAPDLSTLGNNLLEIIARQSVVLKETIFEGGNKREKPSLPTMIDQDMLQYEELFREVCQTLTQGLENLVFLLNNLIQSSGSIMTFEKIYYLFQEYWRIILEQIQYAEDFYEYSQYRQQRDQLRKGSLSDTTNASNSATHGTQSALLSSIYNNGLATILNFSVLKLTIEVIPSLLSSETEFYLLLFQIVLDYFFSCHSNNTYENMAGFYKQKFLFHFQQITQESDINSGNPNIIPGGGGKATILVETISKEFPQLKTLNPRLFQFVTQMNRTDERFGIVRKEELNLPKLKKLSSGTDTSTLPILKQGTRNTESSAKKSLNTITEDDDISDLGSRSDEDDEQQHLALDDHFIVEENRLSEHSKYLFKQSLNLLSQFFGTGILGTFHSRYHSQYLQKHPHPLQQTATQKGTNYYYTNQLLKHSPQFKENHSQTLTTLSIITAIEKNIDEFIDWISDISLSLEEIYESYDIFFTPLEEIIFTMIMKPILFPQVLLKHYYLYGLNLNLSSMADIQSWILQQAMIRKEREQLKVNLSTQSRLSFLYGNKTFMNEMLRCSYLTSKSQLCILDPFHYFVLQKAEQEEKIYLVSRLPSQREMLREDSSSMGSSRSLDTSVGTFQRSTSMNKSQRFTLSRFSSIRAEETVLKVKGHLSLPHYLFPSELGVLLQRQFRHLESGFWQRLIRDINSGSVNFQSQQKEREIVLSLVGDDLSRNGSLLVPPSLSASHGTSGWNRLLPRFSVIHLTKLIQQLGTSQVKLSLSIASQPIQRYFTEQYHYLTVNTVNVEKEKSSTFRQSILHLAYYHFLFSSNYFIHLLSTLLERVSVTPEQILQLNSSTGGSSPTIIMTSVASRYSKLFSFLENQFVYTTSGTAASSSTGTSSLLLFLQTNQKNRCDKELKDGDSSSPIDASIVMSQIHEEYRQELGQLFTRMRMLLVFSHLSFFYFIYGMTTYSVFGGCSSSILGSYPQHSSLLSFLSSDEFLMQAVESLENLFLQHFMLEIEYEVKRYHEFQKLYYQEQQRQQQILPDENNPLPALPSFQLKSARELIMQSLAFINEQKLIQNLLYSIYYSKFSATSFYSIKDYHFLKSVLKSFFSEASLHYHYQYLLLNQVKIPQSFISSDIQSFLLALKEFFEESSSVDHEDGEDEEESEEEEEEGGEEENHDEEEDEKEGKEEIEGKEKSNAEYKMDENKDDLSSKNDREENISKKYSLAASSRRSTMTHRRPRYQWVRNQQLENLICDLLFLNPNFLSQKYFYLVQQISRETQHQLAIQQVIDQHNYDDFNGLTLTTQKPIVVDSGPAVGSGTSSALSSRLSQINTTTTNNSNTNPRSAPSSLSAAAQISLRSRHYYDLLQMKSLCSNHFSLLIQQSLVSFYRKLRSIEKITWKDNKEILQQMKEHSLVDGMKYGGGAAGTGKSSVTGKGGATRRRFGQRIILRFQSREYDPLWAFLLLEVYNFNRSYLLIVKYFLSFLETMRSSEDWMKYFEQFLLQHPLLYQYHPAVNSSVERRIQSQRDVIQSICIQSIVQLSQQCIPAIWLHYQDSIFAATPNCSMEMWVQTIQSQRQMLWQWLVDGKPSNISLYLLHHPAGFLYALRETFAMKAESAIDKVYLHYEVIPLILHQQEQLFYFHQNHQQLHPYDLASQPGVPPPPSSGLDAAMSPGSLARKIRKQQSLHNSGKNTGTNSNTDPSLDNPIDMKTIASLFVANSDQSYLTSSLGCYCHLINVSFRNAWFSARTNMMEFMPFHSISPFGTEVVIRLYASLEEQNLSQEDIFACPFFIPANHYHPLSRLPNVFQFPFNRNQSTYPSTHEEIASSTAKTTTETSSSRFFQQDNPELNPFERIGLSAEGRNETKPSFIIPVNTLEDREDCRLNRICVVSCPPWLVPHN